jgi:superfamily II DNA helicase RecQ
MLIKIINVLLNDETMQVELNKFLSSHRILEIEQHFFQNNNSIGWSFCIHYLSQNSKAINFTTKSKVDYKEVLSEKEFEIFSALRIIRKQLAEENFVPAYAIFTDEELSLISQLSELTPKKLTTINGIGEKKVEKYGKEMIERYLKNKEEELSKDEKD